MFDIPNSPNELFKKIGSETAYQVLVDTQIELCQEMLDHLTSGHHDDQTVQVNVGRMKELLAACLFHCKTAQKIIDVCKAADNQK